MTKKKRPLDLLPIGRPRVIDESVVRELEGALAWDCTVEEACAYAGIGERTYYDERKRNPDFVQKMDKAQRFPFVLAKKVVMQVINEKDGNLAMKLLERRQRDRYHTKFEQEVRQTTVEEVLDEVEAQTEYPEQFEVPRAEKKAGV